jgi:two-component system, response regulator
MKQHSKPITILLADDDADDRLLVQEAFNENRMINTLETVVDGVELMAYLRREGKYSGVKSSPDLLLLDLNMPRKSGLEALKEIKSDANLRRLPVVILTTSKAEEDIVRSYDLGVNSFIVKPVTFDSLVELIKNLDKYWFQIVERPTPAN